MLLPTTKLDPPQHLATTQVKLVVIDSIAFHYRADASDAARRTRDLTATAAELMRLANTARLAVVIMNQVTTQVGAEGGKLVPALGACDAL